MAIQQCSELLKKATSCQLLYSYFLAFIVLFKTLRNILINLFFFYFFFFFLFPYCQTVFSNLLTLNVAEFNILLLTHPHLYRKFTDVRKAFQKKKKKALKGICKLSKVSHIAFLVIQKQLLFVKLKEFSKILKVNNLHHTPKIIIFQLIFVD